MVYLVHTPDFLLGLLTIGHQNFSVTQKLRDHLFLLLVAVFEEVCSVQVEAVWLDAAVLAKVGEAVLTVFKRLKKIILSMKYSFNLGRAPVPF